MIPLRETFVLQDDQPTADLKTGRDRCFRHSNGQPCRQSSAAVIVFPYMYFQNLKFVSSMARASGIG